MKFEKPALKVQDQIDLLQQRGMNIPDVSQAEHYLQRVSYYRLRGYWIPFEIEAASGDHAFAPGTSFDQVIDVYNFDRELRLLVLDAIEIVEVAVRGEWAYQFATKYGPHSHLVPNLFAKEHFFLSAKKKLQEEVNRSKDLFIQSYKRKYKEPNLPPIWMSVEIMSLGQLSKWIANIRLDRDVRALSSNLGLNGLGVLSGVLHHLVYVRNTCAHHARLWNRAMAIQMPVPTSLNTHSESMLVADRNKIHNTLVVLDYLLSRYSPHSTWRHRLDGLLATCPDPTRRTMGFPEDWSSLKPW